MPNTYEAIASVTSTGGGTLSFTSIPQTYTDLICIVNAGFVSAASLYVRVNNDSGTNYSQTIMRGSGTATESARTVSTTLYYLDYYGNTVANNINGLHIVQFMNYNNANVYKTMLTRANMAAGSGVETSVGVWRSTAAITTFFVGSNAGAILAGTTATLYGIKAA
jgi:hypothetical protein